MGHSSIILVLTVIGTLGIMSYSINKRGNDAALNSAVYYNKTHAKNIASSAVEVYIRKLKDNPQLRGTFTLSEFLGGRATVSISEVKAGKVDTLLMETVGMIGIGTEGFTTDTIRNMLAAVPLEPPDVSAAVSVSFGTKAHIHPGKNTVIDGRNHDLNGNLDTTACAALPGISVGHTENGSNDEDDTIVIDDPNSVKVKGKGSVEPDLEIKPQQDYSDWVKKLISMADKVYSNKEVQKEDTLGSLANPQITYVTGNTHFNKNTTGAGILLVEGNLKTSGDFLFHGLIIAVGDSTSHENVQIEKRSEIRGALILSGAKTKFHTKGTSEILYSCDALKMAFANLVGRYEISNWWE